MTEAGWEGAWKELRLRLIGNASWHQQQAKDTNAGLSEHHDSCARALGWAIGVMSEIQSRGSE